MAAFDCRSVVNHDRPKSIVKIKKNLTEDTNLTTSFLCALRGELRVGRYYELHPGQPHIIMFFDIFVYIFSLYILFVCSLYTPYILCYSRHCCSVHEEGCKV